RLEPDQRGAERRPFHFRDVIGIVQADRHELARRDWNVDLQFPQGNSRARKIEVKPVRLCEHVHLGSAHFAVQEFLTESEATENSHVASADYADFRRLKKAGTHFSENLRRSA